LGTGPAAFATEPLFQRSVNLANFGGKTIRLRFRYSLGAEDRAGSVPLGWYVDNITIINDNWVDVASTTGTSLLQTKGNGTYCYRVRTTYTLGAETVPSPFSNVVSVTVAAAPQPDLVVSNLTASNNKASQGDKVTFTAVITNTGGQNAGASQTRFLLDGVTQLGLIYTPGLAPGASVTVSANWLTAGAKKGTHSVKASADSTKAVTESDEANNDRTITVSIQGNRT